MVEIGTSTHPTPHAEARYILLAKQKILTHQGNFLFTLADFHPSADMHSVFCGQFEGNDIFVCRFPHTPKGFQEQGLRDMLFELDDYYYGLLSRAHQLATWDADHQFCGRCGHPLTTKHHKEHAKLCGNCNLRHYPRISPCIIVSVRKGNQLLLARSFVMEEGRYSNIAGFVEAGETLEQAVQREVMEEVGIEIHNIQYIGSQPWSFPHQLMVGFYAEYRSGELFPAPDEIAEAGWWDYNDLPNIPNPTSISGQLILSHAEKIAQEA
ncbi:NAD(+) diphosphatase [Marinomonas ostreistagni]|uniref:NAD(+) diphosphatase n=1 Tax=Marinomonas ostreistagni TaxID=359209 RepID=UPI001950778A|nr:NAD(+) diphosphatase [Marinomonas ostreistagni]MBM6552172.1 NAD(+) diphosphatase [Marinomonas ostreistagni]